MTIPDAPLSLLAALSLALFAQAPAPPQQGYTEVERGPNWVKSTYHFGAFGTAAGQFLEPRAVAVGRDNRIYVADTGNHRIQIFSIDGKPAGGWGRRGSASSEFLFPSGIAVGPEEEIYVADTGNDRIQVFDEKGTFLRAWGKPGISTEEFSSPRWLAVSKDRVVVSEGDLPRVQIFSPRGEFIRAIGGFGDGAGRFREPSGVALDEQGNFYVADAGAHRIQKFDAQGESLAQWGLWGAHAGMLSGPAGLAWSAGKLYVSDMANHRVEVFDGSGAFLFQWGRHPAFAHEGLGRLHFPSGIAVSPSGGYTVLCEPYEHRVQAFTNGSARNPKTMTELPWWDAMHARFHVRPRLTEPKGDKPTALIARLEPDTHSVLFFDLEPQYPSYVGRAGGFGMKLGEFNNPAGLALNAATGRLLVSERGNRRIQLLELPRDPKSVTGFAPGVRVIAAWDLAALLPAAPEGIRLERCSPGNLALDSDGSLFVVDEGNSAVLVFDRQMKYSRAIVAAARPSRFVDVAPAGKTLYVVDRGALKVLAFDAAGKLLDSWGSGGAGGSGGEAWLPSGIAADAEGNLYVSDAGGQQILKFDGRGKFLLKWGSFGREVSQFYTPRGVVVAKGNRIVVDDFGNHRAHIFGSDGQVIELFHIGGYTPPAPVK